MIALRWLPLSLAVHAVVLGGAAWVAERIAGSALFVDLTLAESDGDDRRATVAPASPADGRSRAAGRVSRPGSVAVAATSTPSVVQPPSVPQAATPPPAATAPLPPSASTPTPPPADAVAAAPAGTAWSTSREDTPAPPPIGGGPQAPGDGASTSGARVGGDVASDASGWVGGGRGEGGGDDRLALAIPGDAVGGTYGAYLAALRRRVQDALAYPAAARRRGISGTVHLDIVLEANGVVSDVIVVRSSAHALLDDAAVEAARGVGRVPFPPGVRPRALRVRLPVVFQLN